MVADAEAIERESELTSVLSDERRDFRGSFSGYERDKLFYNPNGDFDGFVPSAYVFGLDYDHDGRAAAPVDIDGDGDLDLALLTLHGLRMLENTADEQRSPAFHHVRLSLKSTRLEAHGLGASVALTAGGITHRDYVKITDGFQTQVPFDLHVGLGAADVIDTLEVRWPSGARDVWADLSVDRLIEVEEGREVVEVKPLPRWPDSTRPRVNDVPLATIKASRLEGDFALMVGDKPVVINFWAPWCAPCKTELPQLADLAGRYQREVDFVGVSVELTDLESVHDAIRDFKIPYPQFLADDLMMKQFFGIDGEVALPSTYVFDERNRLRRVFRGPITEVDLDRLLQSLSDEGVFEADLELAARTTLRLREYEEAIGYYQRLADLQPNSVHPLYQIGVAALELGDPDRAREAFEQAVGKSPTHVMAQFMLGVARMQSGMPGEAFANFQGALELARNNALALRSLGNAASDFGQIWLAIDAFTQALEGDPRSAETWVDRARANLARGSHARAASDYAEALKLDPENTAVREELERLSDAP